MDTTSPLYHQIFNQLGQYSQASDRRHLKAIAWMCTALLLSQSLTLSTWEPYVQRQAKQAQSYERRWQRFLENPAIWVEKLYRPLVVAALSPWHGLRLYLALVSVAFSEYEPLLRKAHSVLRQHQEMMLLADRAFACHDLMDWLKGRPWHDALRLKSDVI